MEIIPEAFSPLYPRAFIIVINSLDSPHNKLTHNALYPWRTSVGKAKQILSIGMCIGSAKFKHERNAIMQHISHALAQCASPQITSGPASCRRIKEGVASLRRFVFVRHVRRLREAHLPPTVPRSVHANNLSLEICVLLVVKSLHSSRDCWTCSRLCVRTL